MSIQGHLKEPSWFCVIEWRDCCLHCALPRSISRGSKAGVCNDLPILFLNIPCGVISAKPKHLSFA